MSFLSLVNLLQETTEQKKKYAHGYFALALNKEFGYKLYMLLNEKSDIKDGFLGSLIHIFCKRHGKYIDVNGISTQQEFYSKLGNWSLSGEEYVSKRNLLSIYKGSGVGLDNSLLVKSLSIIRSNPYKYLV